MAYLYASPVTAELQEFASLLVFYNPKFSLTTFCEPVTWMSSVISFSLSTSWSQLFVLMWPSVDCCIIESALTCCVYVHSTFFLLYCGTPPFASRLLCGRLIVIRMHSLCSKWATFGSWTSVQPLTKFQNNLIFLHRSCQDGKFGELDDSQKYCGRFRFGKLLNVVGRVFYYVCPWPQSNN